MNSWFYGVLHYVVMLHPGGITCRELAQLKGQKFKVTRTSYRIPRKCTWIANISHASFQLGHMLISRNSGKMSSVQSKRPKWVS